MTQKQWHSGEALPLGVLVNGMTDAAKPSSLFAGLFSKIKTLFSYSAILKIELFKALKLPAHLISLSA